MRLFLDASVVLAACGRVAGASHAIFDLAAAQGWRLIVGDYVLREVERRPETLSSLAMIPDIAASVVPITSSNADFKVIDLVPFSEQARNALVSGAVQPFSVTVSRSVIP